MARLSLANFCTSFVKITQIIGNFGVFARLAGGDGVAELPLCDREALLESLERRPLRGTSSFFSLSPGGRGALRRVRLRALGDRVDQ